MELDGGFFVEYTNATLYFVLVMATYVLHLLSSFNVPFPQIQSSIGFVGYIKTRSKPSPLEFPNKSTPYQYKHSHRRNFLEAFSSHNHHHLQTQNACKTT